MTETLTNKKPKRLSKKQKEFANKFLDTGNATKSALEAYDTKDYNTAAVIGSENLTKPNVREYIEGKAQRAAEITFELAERAENEGVRLGAAKDIQDRAGLKPIEKSMNVEVKVEVDTEKAKAFDEWYATQLKGH